LVRRIDWVRDRNGGREFFLPGFSRADEDAALAVVMDWAEANPTKMGAWIAKVEDANRRHACPYPACSGKGPAA
jgi:hypothetical protein